MLAAVEDCFEKVVALEYIQRNAGFDSH